MKIDVLHFRNGKYCIVGKPDDLFSSIREEMGDDVYYAIRDALDESNPSREELEFLRNENVMLERDNKFLAAELEYLRKRVKEELEPRLAKEREAYEEWAKVIKALHPEREL